MHGVLLRACVHDKAVTILPESCDVFLPLWSSKMSWGVKVVLECAKRAPEYFSVLFLGRGSAADHTTKYRPGTFRHITSASSSACFSYACAIFAGQSKA